jgi:NAD(P)-dependent dehydrogenase (short-subunit alcohol dehydrogenase family)
MMESSKYLDKEVLSLGLKQRDKTGVYRTDFTKHVVLITGGTSGIGREIAAAYMRAGASVALVGQNEQRGMQAEKTIGALKRSAGQQCVFFPGDVSSRTDLDRVLGQIEERFGVLNAVVCSAGIGRKATLLETSEADLASLYRVNVQGAITTVQASAKLLKQSSGAVVLISSDAGISGENLAGAYSVTKAALNMAGKMLALDLAPDGVRVNVVAPGDIAPGMKTMVKAGETLRAEDDYLSWPLPPIGRYGRASDVADAVLFLTSASASFITGSVLLIDGGMRAGFLHGAPSESPSR